MDHFFLIYTCSVGHDTQTEICLLLPLPARAAPSPESLAREILALPRAQRLVLLLRHYDELSEHSVARLLELPEETVRLALERGEKALTERCLRRVTCRQIRDAFSFAIEHEAVSGLPQEHFFSDLCKILPP